MKTYYEILGVDMSATQEEIKKAFKKMMRRWHPDMNPGNENAIKMTQLINEAYSVLSDISKKKQYDSKLANAKKQNSSKQSKSSSGTSKFYQGTTNRTTKPSRNDSINKDTDSRKKDEAVLKVLRKANDAFFSVFTSLITDIEIPKLKKIEIILDSLKKIDVIYNKNLSMIGLSFKKISDCDFSGCKLDLHELKLILIECARCEVLKDNFKHLKNKYNLEVNASGASSNGYGKFNTNYGTFNTNYGTFNTNYGTFEKNNINIEKKIIKNKFY